MQIFYLAGKKYSAIDGPISNTPMNKYPIHHAPIQVGSFADKPGGAKNGCIQFKSHPVICQVLIFSKISKLLENRLPI